MMKSMLLMILIGMLVSGCIVKYVEPRLPIIAMPQRPHLYPVSEDELKSLSPNTKDKLYYRDNELKKYAKKLEIGINTYNDFAKEHNKEFGYH